MVVHLCSWARLQQTAGDSYSVPKVPKEQALNYLKRKRAARLKIKQEKTFQRELFTGHDSGASDVPLQPGSQLQNDSPSLFLFFPPSLTSRNSLQVRCRSKPVALLLLSLLRCQHRLLFVTSLKLLWILTVAVSVQANTSPDGGNDILLLAGERLAKTARGERRKLPFGKAIRSTLRVWPSHVYMQ